MPAQIGVGVMAALLVLYLVVAVQLAIGFFEVGTTVSTIMGVALLVLPLVGFWALGAELLFGFRSQRLGRLMAREGSLPDDEFDLLPSGRPDPAAARVHVPRFQADADAAPADWRAAYRLGLVLDAAGERKLARPAITRAIALERAERDAAADRGE
ncbi:MAG: hypothetical protein KF680_11335 [Cryobacterium sp.]|nr:hypothetical protein [Cryobacterium sp.]